MKLSETKGTAGDTSKEQRWHWSTWWIETLAGQFKGLLDDNETTIQTETTWHPGRNWDGPIPWVLPSRDSHTCWKNITSLPKNHSKPAIVTSCNFMFKDVWESFTTPSCFFCNRNGHKCSNCIVTSGVTAGASQGPRPRPRFSSPLDGRERWPTQERLSSIEQRWKFERLEFIICWNQHHSHKNQNNII